jgi:iron complex outermembrane receptor protein
LVQQQVPGYTRLDLRLGWKPTQPLEFSLGGQNLLADHHPEYRAVYVVTPTEVPRNLYVKVVWRF